ncbi:MAG: 50S ribosomal protein L18 [Candidatus Hydrogenedentes bacterium]|nr:50S ribosomal protein L18 [Candidatus Hydrogenedentota bacterium]
MKKIYLKQIRLERRKKRVRKKIFGTAERPRLRVVRTLNHIYAQIIDDARAHTLVSESSVQMKIKGGNIESAKLVGYSLGKKALEAGITKVCFDRGGRKYHGRIKALADAVREAGLQF